MGTQIEMRTEGGGGGGYIDRYAIKLIYLNKLIDRLQTSPLRIRKAWGGHFISGCKFLNFKMDYGVICVL